MLRIVLIDRKTGQPRAGFAFDTCLQCSIEKWTGRDWPDAAAIGLLSKDFLIHGSKGWQAVLTIGHGANRRSCNRRMARGLATTGSAIMRRTRQGPLRLSRFGSQCPVSPLVQTMLSSHGGMTPDRTLSVR